MMISSGRGKITLAITRAITLAITLASWNMLKQGIEHQEEEILMKHTVPIQQALENLCTENGDS